MQPSPAQTDSKIITWETIPSAADVPDLPVEWLCDRLIPRAGITLLAGEPSACKTWLALALAKAVSDGGQFIGLQCERAPVLYLDRENPASVIRDRLCRIGIDFTNSHRHANFKYWGGWQADAPPGIGDFRLEEMSLRGPLIILDPFVRFHGGDENSASEMARVMAELRKLAFRGASVLAIHHKSKTEASKYRGSSDIAAGVDVGIALSKDDASGILTLRAFKNRMGTDFTYNVRADFDPEAVVFTLTDPPEDDATESLKIKLLTAIAEHSGSTQQEIVRLAGIPANRGKGLLKQFEGQLWTAKGGPGHSRLYYPLEPQEAGLGFSS
jgi:hypothetical protein